MNEIRSFLKELPKAEIHLHIEGTLEPELMFEIARRNKVKIRFSSPAEVREAYQFKDLQSFLNIYYEGASVLLTEQDFFDLTWAYLKKAQTENIRHTEIFFDPQTHTQRGVPFGTVVAGISRALEEAKTKFGMTSNLILCFLRDLSKEAALKTLEEARPFRKQIIAVGLDSAEVGNPPAKFATVFNKAIQQGYLSVAHAGEEGPASYIKEALDLLKVKRIDHGVRCLEDKGVVKTLADKKIPLTVCPLSNVKLKVFDRLEKHSLKKLLSAGLMVTINSDDPAYFGGYLLENYIQVERALRLKPSELLQIAKNSFNASFLSKGLKQKYLREVDQVAAKYGIKAS